MTELEVYRPSGAVSERDVVDGWIRVADDVSKLANFIAETDFVPKALRNKPAAVAAAMLTGRELGIGPMQSLKSIHMVQGTPSLSSEYKRARALAAGHDIVFDETNSTRCIVRGRRAGTERWVTISWTMDMAKRAKLTGKEVWQAYPQRMLQARASGELCDLLFPDTSLGLATTEVLEDGGVVTADGAVVDAAAGALATGEGKPAAIEPPKPKTAQRKTSPAKGGRKTAAPAAPASDAGQPAGNEPASAGAAALPPLPGEEPGPTASGASAPAAPDGPRQQTSKSPPPSGDGSGSTPPDETDYDTEGTVTPDQLKAIWTILSTVYHFDRDDRDSARDVCAHITGHTLASSKDLSRNEAKAVLDTLSRWQQQAKREGEDARAYMLAVTAGAVSE